MAAAAAKKLLLRRTHEAVQLPRIVHTVAGSSSRRSMSAAAPNTDANSKAAEIRGQLLRKKEELYSLLDLVEREQHYKGLSYFRVLVERKRNLKLLQRLSVQIDPKPTDPEWRWHRGFHIFSYIALCVTSGLAGAALGDMHGDMPWPAMKEEDGNDGDDRHRHYGHDPEQIVAYVGSGLVKDMEIVPAARQEDGYPDFIPVLLRQAFGEPCGVDAAAEVVSAPSVPSGAP